MKLDKHNKEYIEWLHNLKDKIGKAQIKAAISVNSELIKLYWELEKNYLKNKKNRVGGILLLKIYQKT